MQNNNDNNNNSEAGQSSSGRKQLHNYLSALFDKDTNMGAAYHNLQLELYADYAPEKLLTFLRLSAHYSMEKALQLCESRKLIREQVYLLGRMGNNRQALMIIVEQLNDVQLVRRQAVRFNN